MKNNYLITSAINDNTDDFDFVVLKGSQCQAILAFSKDCIFIAFIRAARNLAKDKQFLYTQSCNLSLTNQVLLIVSTQ